ncbi:type II secretion system protein [Chthoniobacter flavus]|nr:prepilin-type N-terminal cleavage/methylation domain-containing protein [Chthoniobacter flavus]
MNPFRNHLRRGFTLVEIMVVVSIIALLAAIATSNFIRARKRAQAAKILDDLRTLDGALDQYAIENNKNSGDLAMFSDLQPYMKRMNKLALMGADIFGQPYGPYTVDTPPKVSDRAFQSLSDVAPESFWSPYY